MNIRIKTIDEILEEIQEDKKDNLSTTSYKFKKDLWEFFSNNENSHKISCVEFGTHKGQTTRVLSFLFKVVYTINLPNHFSEAQALNNDRENIFYKPMNLYQQPLDKNFGHKPISVFFIDAVHSFDAVMADFTRCLNFKLCPEGEIYFIFDDYGAYREIYQAVNQLIRIGKIEKVSYIGHTPNHSFGGHPERILQDHEGIICSLIRS